MTDYLHIQLPPDQIRGISSIGLAHMGDAVYELLVRTWLCAHGKATGKGLHRATVALVCAPKQAELAQQQLPKLRGCDAHFTVILSEVDESLLKRLGINVSCEARYETKKLYHK